MLELCVRSIRRFHSRADLDVVVMCDAAFAPHIVLDDVHVIETPTMPGPGLNTSMRKVDIPDYLRKYDKVLYLDCDVVVCGSLSPLFRTIEEDGVLYTCAEGGPSHHRHLFWSLLAHTCEELEELERRNVGVFNCGQFGFVPGDGTFEHFANIRRLMRTHDGPFFVEQSFMNHYFARHPSCVNPTLTPFVRLAAREYDPDVVVAHFSDASIGWRRKLEMMREWFARFNERVLLDPFKLLGVEYGSSTDEARKRYYELAMLAHPDRGGTPEQMRTLHDAYCFVKTQLALNETSKPYEELQREFAEFCEHQKNEPPPFADIYAEAFDLPRFRELFANSAVVDGAFAPGGYEVVPSTATPGEYVPEPPAESVTPFETRVVEYREPPGVQTRTELYRDLTRAPVEPYSCRLRNVHACDYRDGLAPSVAPPEAAAVATANLTNEDVCVAFKKERDARTPVQTPHA